MGAKSTDTFTEGQIRGYAEMYRDFAASLDDTADKMQNAKPPVPMLTIEGIGSLDDGEQAIRSFVNNAKAAFHRQRICGGEPPAEDPIAGNKRRHKAPAE